VKPAEQRAVAASANQKLHAGAEEIRGLYSMLPEHRSESVADPAGQLFFVIVDIDSLKGFSDTVVIVHTRLLLD
jgi:hypothetical protein